VSANNTANFISAGQGFVNPQVAGADAEGNYIVTWQDLVSSGDDPLSRVSARRFHAAMNQWRTTVAVGDANDRPSRVTVDARGSATVAFGATSGQAMQAASFR